MQGGVPHACQDWLSPAVLPQVCMSMQLMQEVRRSSRFMHRIVYIAKRVVSRDPTQNIKWTVPEGGGGPNYTMM